MSDLNKKITELLSDSCKAAPDMTHSLKIIGDGDMKEGMKTIAEFFEENGMKKRCFIRHSRNSYCYRINSWSKKDLFNEKSS